MRSGLRYAERSLSWQILREIEVVFTMRQVLPMVLVFQLFLHVGKTQGKLILIFVNTIVSSGKIMILRNSKRISQTASLQFLEMGQAGQPVDGCWQLRGWEDSNTCNHKTCDHSDQAQP